MSLSPSSRFRLKPRTLLFGGLGLLILAVAAFFLFGKKKEEEPYRFGTVAKGDITRTVSASGSLEALVTVTVGSQLSGQVRQVLVDFNDHVVRGQLMAVLDPSTYESRVAQTQADVNAQVSAVTQQQAQVGEAEANLKTQQAAYNRTKTLYDKGYQSKAALDLAASALAQAQAGLTSARSGVSAQRSRVQQSQASLSSNKVDLARTRIVAPIDGVVIDRQIEPGQTVAASLSAPTLFVLAQDLERLQAKILVDEADIGQVREGQKVKFTVDAFPDETFVGIVTQVRKQPQSEQNVVAYVVLAQADNPDGKLLPGMTANADIVIEELKGVMTVPSAALRFTPPTAAGASPQTRAGPGGAGAPGGPGGARQGAGGRQGGGAFGGRMLDDLGLDASQKAKADVIFQEARQKAQSASGGDRRTAMREAMNAAFDKLKPILRPDQQAKLEVLRARFAGGGKRGVVWVLRDGKPVPISVRVGVADANATQITSRDLKVGDQVIIGGGPRPKAKAASPLAAAAGGQRGAGGGGRRGGL